MKLNPASYASPFGAASTTQPAYTPFIDRLLDQVLLSKHEPGVVQQEISYPLVAMMSILAVLNQGVIHLILRPQTELHLSNDRRLIYRSYAHLFLILFFFLFLDIHLLQVAIYGTLCIQPMIGARLLGFPQRYGPMRDAANTLIIFGIFDTRVMAVILVLFYAHFSYTMLKALILHFHPIRVLAALNFVILIDHILHYPGGVYKMGTTFLLHYSTFLLLTLAPYNMKQVYTEYYGDWTVDNRPREEVFQVELL